MIFDNFKFFYELIITHYNKFSKKNELEKFTALAANSLALLQKEKAPLGFFVVDEFRRGAWVRDESYWSGKLVSLKMGTKPVAR